MYRMWGGEVKLFRIWGMTVNKDIDLSVHHCMLMKKGRTGNVDF